MVELLKDELILGYHCSNLFDYERDDILKNGLKPLSAEFRNHKIETAYRKKLITAEMKNMLLNNGTVITHSKVGTVFFFHHPNTLLDESGVKRLITEWGGEAIYWDVPDNKKLKKLGTSSIVVLSIKFSSLSKTNQYRFVDSLINNSLFLNDENDIDNLVEDETVSVLEIIPFEEVIETNPTRFGENKK